MIYIYTGNGTNPTNNEWYYCKHVCKAADATLTDNDITRIVSANSAQEAIDFVAKHGNKKKDILIIPFVNINFYKDYFFQKYPLVNLAMPHCRAGSFGSTFPTTATLTPDEIPAIISVGGGINGISDWFTGPALEFVERALVFGANEQRQEVIIHSAVENITNLGGGLMKIQTLGAYSASPGFLYRVSGVVSTFQNNPNGTYAVVERHVWDGTGTYSPTENWITVNFNPGTGSYTSGGIIDCEFLSGAVANGGTILHKIARERNTSIQIARRIARITGSQNGIHTNETGYGSIDVDAAINYDGSIPDDNYDILGDADQLTVSVDEKGGIDFTHPEIENAKEIWIYRGSKVIAKKFMNPGEALNYHMDSTKLFSQTYYVRGKRGGLFTAPSLSDSTDIAAVTGYPKKALHRIGLRVTFLDKKNNVRGGQLDILYEIDKITYTVKNTSFDSKPSQSIQYKLKNKIIIDADQVSVTPGALFGKKLTEKNGSLSYLNSYRVVSLDPFSTGINTDFTATNFQDTDFTKDGDCSFLGAILSYTDLSSAILPDAFSDLGDFLYYVLNYDGYINPNTVIWTTGEMIADTAEWQALI